MLRVPFLSLDYQHRSIEHELKEIFKRIVERGGFILGEEIASFESEFAAYHNAKYCISEANVHEALLISLKAIDVGKGDEGVVSSTCRQLGWR